jgi:hypothetical protein
MASVDCTIAAGVQSNKYLLKFHRLLDLPKKTISRVEAEITIPRAAGFEGQELSTTS